MFKSGSSSLSKGKSKSKSKSKDKDKEKGVKDAPKGKRPSGDTRRSYAKSTEASKKI